MYESFGAIVRDNRVEFRLFLPDNRKDPAQFIRGGTHGIRRVHVRGNFQSEIGGVDWQLDPTLEMTDAGDHPSGQLYRVSLNTDLPEGYYEYKYFVEFENETTRWVADPVNRYGGSDASGNSAFVVGGNRVTVQPIARRMPPRDLIIYELHFDDFTAEFRADRAPIDAVRDRLDYLQSLGINAIEFMPWTAWAGLGFSWGYDPVELFSVEYRYLNDGTAPADKLVKLGMLINDMHQRGMHVIMDGVFNHVRAGVDPNQGFGYKWLYQNPADTPFIGAFAGGAFFDDLDYNNGCTEQFIRDACFYWLDVFQIDGIRFDYSLGFFRRGDRDHGITKLIADIRDHCSQAGKTNISLFIEHLTDDRFEAIADTNEICANGCWFDPIMFKNWEYVHNGNIDMDILRRLDANRDFAVDKGPVTYIENHDHSTIVSIAGGRDRWFKTQPAAIALLTSPGAVLIHNGQEFGEDYFLPESGDGRVQPRPLHWATRSSLGGDAVGGRLFGIYQQLIGIRSDHPALRSPNFFPPENQPDGYGAFPDPDVVIFQRWGAGADGRLERFIVVINYSDFDQRIDIPFPANGSWQDLLNGGSVIVENNRLSNQRIGSNWARIYFQTA